MTLAALPVSAQSRAKEGCGVSGAGGTVLTSPPHPKPACSLCHCLTGAPKGPCDLRGKGAALGHVAGTQSPQLHSHVCLLFGDTLFLVTLWHVNHLSAVHPNISFLVILSDHHR